MILCALLIFLLIPLGNAIQKFVSDSLGRKFFIYFILTVLALVFTSLIYLLFYKFKIRSSSNYIWLFALTGIYAYLILKIRHSPVEVSHFLEYGLLSFFLFKALNNYIKNKSIYFSGALFTLLIGTLDEIIQWFVPERIWNFRDVGLNTISGGLIQLAIWKVLRPKSISEKIDSRSLWIFASLFASCLIILGLCASNTPQRVYGYTKKIPWLSYLQKEEPMSEFGYKYKDPEIGTFYSRLSPIRLQKIDNNRGEEYAQILNKAVNIDYKQFIKNYNPISNPFLHEIRVHIFRRDKYYKMAIKTSNINKKKEFYFTAYKENLILKKYFGRSIKNSVYWWDNDKIKKFEDLIDKKASYISPVSANLFTTFSEKTMWIFILALIIFLVITNLSLFIINKKKKSFLSNSELL